MSVNVDVDVDAVVNTDVVLKLKYRPDSNVYKYDKYDELYAIELKRHFSRLSEDAQKEFNLFTDNLMVEKFINRNYLLDAITDFKKTDYFKTIKNEYELPHYAWVIFDDNSYNCRPYQPCVIS
jgi:hypothetical protein